MPIKFPKMPHEEAREHMIKRIREMEYEKMNDEELAEVHEAATWANRSRIMRVCLGKSTIIRERWAQGTRERNAPDIEEG